MPHRILRILPAATLALLALTSPTPADPPAHPNPTPATSGFRGDGSGSFPNTNPPTTWDSDKRQNVLWSVKIAKSLYNSPIIAGNKIFLLAEPGNLLCLDADTGKQLWSKTTTLADLPDKVEETPSHDEVGNTTPCPVTNGKNVYIVFANGIITAFDLDGKRQWITFIGEPCATGYGRAASPILASGKLIVSMGFLAALDAQTGKPLWKAEKVEETYGTPALAKVGDTELIVSPAGSIVNAADGAVIHKGYGELTYNTPVVAADKAFFADDDSYAIQLGAKTPDFKKLWHADLDGDVFASPVYHDGLLYAATNNGQLAVFDAATGKTVYTKDLPIGNMSGKPDVPVANLYPSLCFAGKYLFVSNDQGETLVLEPGRQYKQIALNHIDDTLAGSFLFVGNRIYIRAKTALYCLQNP